MKRRQSAGDMAMEAVDGSRSDSKYLEILPFASPSSASYTVTRIAISDIAHQSPSPRAPLSLSAVCRSIAPSSTRLRSRWLSGIT